MGYNGNGIVRGRKIEMQEREGDEGALRCFPVLADRARKI